MSNSRYGAEVRLATGKSLQHRVQKLSLPGAPNSQCTVWSCVPKLSLAHSHYLFRATQLKLDHTICAAGYAWSGTPLS